MARKISGGLTGEPSIGVINVGFPATLTAAQDQNITVSPVGNSSFIITNNAILNSQSDLRFGDADSSNWVAFQAPATISSNITWTLPSVDGSSNQVLTTNGAGTLSWSTAAVTISDNTVDSTVHYPALTTSTSGTITTARVSSTKLTFQPSTGILTLSGGTASSTVGTGTLVVAGGVGISGQLTVATIVETSSIALKENVHPIENALASILKLSGVTYDRIDNKEHESGLIAEWVEQILPDLVTKDKFGNAVGVKYTKLTAYLIEAIKSLNQEIEKLKDR
jgi:hypothetical protein